jgi:hypothetical protein
MSRPDRGDPYENLCGFILRFAADPGEPTFRTLPRKRSAGQQKGTYVWTFNGREARWRKKVVFDISKAETVCH